MPPKKQKRRESGKSRAAVVEESALSQVDIAFKQQLTDHYRKLVMTELNGPCALSSSFLGIRQSQQMADELASSQTLIPSLGSHGVFENGIPFYHMHIQTLNSDEYSRLEKNEVRLKSGNFKPTEDAQIRENWQDYCEITGTDPEEAPAYMGCSNHKDKKRGVVYFRPWMCRGLPDRSGIQVYRRCAILFHPAHEDGGYCRPWTKKELKLLAQLGPTAKWAQIGARLNRPRFHCQKAYVNLTKGGSVDIEEKGDLKLLYKHITKALGKDPAKALAYNQLDLLEFTINWEEISSILSWEVEKCKKVYADLKQKMVDAKAATREGDPKYMVKYIRKGLPKVCRQLCRLQTKRDPRLKLTPKQFSEYVKSLYRNHREELETLKKPYRLTKVFIASEALSELAEKDRRSILRRLTYVMTSLEMRGVFDYLPKDQRNALVQMKMIGFIMKKTYYSRVSAKETFERAKRFVEKQGWTPERTVYAYKTSPKKDGSQ